MAVHVAHRPGALVVTVFEGSDPTSLLGLGDELGVVADTEPVLVDLSELTVGPGGRIRHLVALLNSLASPDDRRVWVVAPRLSARRRLRRLGLAEAVRVAPSLGAALTQSTAAAAGAR
jgi:hypothetical protein